MSRSLSKCKSIYLFLNSLVVYSLEENWIETVGGIKEMDDDQWRSLKIPMGLVNSIKKELPSAP